jgi:hypothetical protein
MVKFNPSTTKAFVSMLVLAITLAGCITVPKKKKRKNSSGVVNAQLGHNIIQYAITIDGKHYTQLDRVLPKYKIMTIAITNRALASMKLDPLKDSWKIQDARGRWHRAINSLQIKDPKSWEKIPEKMRKLIEYPLNAPPGFTQTFDIFFPAKVDMTNFRALKYTNTPLKQTFLIRSK